MVWSHKNPQDVAITHFAVLAGVIEKRHFLLRTTQCPHPDLSLCFQSLNPYSFVDDEAYIDIFVGERGSIMSFSGVERLYKGLAGNYVSPSLGVG